MIFPLFSEQPVGSVVLNIQSPRPRHFDSAVPEPHSEGSCLRLKEIMQMNSGWSMLGNILLQKWMDHLDYPKQMMVLTAFVSQDSSILRHVLGDGNCQ